MNPGRSEILGEHAANPERSSQGFGGSSIHTALCGKCGAIKPYAMVGKKCDDCGNKLASREWLCSALEDRLTAQFEDEVRRRARLAYLDISRTDPKESVEMRSQYMNDFAAGAYNWDDDGANPTNHVRVARAKTWGALYLIFLLMRRCDDSVTEQQAKAVWLANPEDALRTYFWALGVVGNSPTPPPEKTEGGDGVKTGSEDDSASEPEATEPEPSGLTAEQWAKRMAEEKARARAKHEAASFSAPAGTGSNGSKRTPTPPEPEPTFN